MKVCLEGNIAVGKSTILEALALHKGIEARGEPTTIWTDFRGSNLLKEFYEDPKNNASELQLLI